MGAGRLGVKSMMHVITEIDPDSGALLARNGIQRRSSAAQVAFFDVDDADAEVQQRQD